MALHVLPFVIATNKTLNNTGTQPVIVPFIEPKWDNNLTIGKSVA